MRSLLVVLVCLSFVSARAYCAAKRNALTLKTERVLSGIDIYNDSIESVISHLGPPTTISEKSTEAVYTWEKGACRVRVAVISGALESGITDIDVWGKEECSGIGTTGQGLNLGAKLPEVRRTYGPPAYFIWKHPRPQILTFDPTCDTAPVLAIDFDENGEVDHMKLTATDFYCF